MQSHAEQVRFAPLNAKSSPNSSMVGIGPASDDERLWAASLMAKSEPWVTLHRSPEQCKRACQNPTDLLFTARKGTELCGFLLARRMGLADSPYIKSLAVEPKFRGQGIGYELLKFAEDLFRAESKHIFLCVSSFNDRARKFYERCGYVAVGELKDYIVSGEDEILMQKRFGVTEVAPNRPISGEQSRGNRRGGRYKGKAVELA